MRRCYYRNDTYKGKGKLVTESKEVPCVHCGGTGENTAPFRSAKAEDGKCSECSGSGKMEIHKEGDSWFSRCPTCEGKGFNDEWDYYSEEHLTPECTRCEATGGLPYLKPVE